MPTYVLEGSPQAQQAAGAEPTSIANVEFADSHPSPPSDVREGEQPRFTLEATNNAKWINPTDPDQCWSLGGGAGYKISLYVVVDRSIEYSEEDCFPTGETWAFDITLPELDPGEHTITARIVGRGSGSISDTYEDTITVTESGDGGGGGGDNGGDGGNGGGGGSDGGKTFTEWWNSLSKNEQYAAVGAGGLATYALLASS